MVGYYWCFKRMLARLDVRVVVVSSDSNFYVMVLIYVVCVQGLKMFYIIYGYLFDGLLFLDFDLSIFDGKVLLDVYNVVGDVWG